MSAGMLLSNITSFALQVAVLVTAGAVLARALRLDEPRAMLAYWRAILLGCLILPLVQPRHVIIPPVLKSAVTVVREGWVVPASDVIVAAAPAPSAWPTTDVVLMTLVAGAAARALWLTIGAFGLRRLRREAVPLDPVPEAVGRARERVGANAGLYVSDRVSGPITFGLIRPIVVFPPTVSTMPAHVQEAIACHELLHVRRRDWLFEIVEEAVRSLLWFHPAIWWLIGRIRLTREQVVDQTTIRLTDSRERYVEALLAVAVSGSPAAFAPASPFLRRHLLKQRVARILQETTMTTRRLIASFTVSAAALTIAAVFAVRAFPLEAQGGAPADNGAPIQLVKGGEHLLHGDTPEYPHRAIEQKVEGDVVVDMTLDERGEVADARIVSGPDELRKATLEAVLRWHYSPAALRSTMTQATLRFRVPAKPPKTLEAANEEVVLSGHVAVHEEARIKGAFAHAPKEHVDGRLKELEKAMADPATTDEQRAEFKTKYFEIERMTEKIRAERHPAEVAVWNDKDGLARTVELKLFVDSERALQEAVEGSPRLADVRAERISDATAKQLLADAGLALGDPMTLETAKRLREAARAIDEHFHLEFEREKEGLVVTIVAR